MAFPLFLLGNFGSVDVFEANDGNNPYRCDLLDGNFFII